MLSETVDQLLFCTCRWPDHQELFLPDQAQYQDSKRTHSFRPLWPTGQSADLNVRGIERVPNHGQSPSRRSHLCMPEARVPSLGRRQSRGQSNAQQPCRASQWSSSARSHDRLRPTQLSPQLGCSPAFKRDVGGRSNALKQSKLFQPTSHGWPALARPQITMPPDRAAALLRSLGRFSSVSCAGQRPADLTNKSHMLETYLQDARRLSMKPSQPCMGDSARTPFQETTELDTFKSSVHYDTVQQHRDDTPTSSLPVPPRILRENKCIQAASAGLVKEHAAGERAVQIDGEPTASEWGWAPSIASTRRSRATAMCSRNLGYAQMHLERIAGR